MLVNACKAQNITRLKCLSHCPKANNITDLDVIDGLKCCCELGFIDGFKLLCDVMITASTLQLLDRHIPSLVQACVKNKKVEMGRLILHKLKLSDAQKLAFLKAVCTGDVVNT